MVRSRAGEYRVRESLRAAARELDLELEIRPDRHFLCSAVLGFSDAASGTIRVQPTHDDTGTEPRPTRHQ